MYKNDDKMAEQKHVLLFNKKDNSDDKITKIENDAETKSVSDKEKIEKEIRNKKDKNDKNTDKKQKLLSAILGYFFDSAERNNLDSKKVNKVVKNVQYLFQKDPKQRDIRCFVCEND